MEGITIGYVLATLAVLVMVGSGYAAAILAFVDLVREWRAQGWDEGGH